ncbi:MAG: preprotein translocase subunit SecY [Vampirovibrionales bacterium]|nr:preprotein translocase subunit SecY [Vampirovibrionales bacterium]
MSRPTSLKRNPRSQIPKLGDFAAMFQASGLKEKLLFTGIAIALFRLGVQIPVWGVTPHAMGHLVRQGLAGFLDLFSGGALSKLSVMALGIGPYITASIILQLMTVAIPRLEEMQKEEGEIGRKKIAQFTRYLSVFLAVFQGFFIARLMWPYLLPGVNVAFFTVSTVLSLTAGSMFALWLAELITDRGIGNGGSILIFAGILAGLPIYFSQTYTLVSGDPGKSFMLLLLMGVFLALIALIIVLQLAERRVPISSAKRQVGNKIYGGQNTHIPFKINPAGVMPIIFAFAVIAFPSTLFQMTSPQPHTWLYDAKLFYETYLGYSGWFFALVMFTLVVFFTFFYASIAPGMQPRDIAENLKKYGSSIPGVKPGRPTAEKLEEILGRIIWVGAAALAIITLVASAAPKILGISTLAGLGATSLLILVGVALDTLNQIRVHLMARQYEGFLK